MGLSKVSRALLKPTGKAPKLSANAASILGIPKSTARARFDAKTARLAREEAGYQKMRSEGMAASKRARAMQAKSAAMKGGSKHRPAGSPRGGQFY